jgi:hypothetical protein
MIKKQRVPAESGETACPSCGAVIKMPPSAKRRRVQCPKCREVVSLDGTDAVQPELVSEPARAPEPAAAEVRSEERRRIEVLEARVQALEAAVRALMEAGPAPSPGAAERKPQWLSAAPRSAPDFSPEQGRVLCHNLGHVRTQAIEIRTPAGDNFARARAEWFKSIFESAGWTVHGPEEVAPRSGAAGLSLGVPELPVAKEAAATYFALKAAGFEAIPILDDRLRVDKSPGATTMALTLPPEKAA